MIILKKFTSSRKKSITLLILTDNLYQSIAADPFLYIYKIPMLLHTCTYSYTKTHSNVYMHDHRPTHKHVNIHVSVHMYTHSV